MTLKVLKEFYTPVGYVLSPGTNIEVTKIDDGVYWAKYKTKYTVTEFGITPMLIKKGFFTEIIEPTEKE